MSRTFVDASVLVRLFDDDELHRQAAARSLVGKLDGPTLVVSGPVLAEFADTVTARMARPLTGLLARRALTELAELTVIAADASLVLAAAGMAEESGLAIRDALAVEAAQPSDVEQVGRSSRRL